MEFLSGSYFQVELSIEDKTSGKKEEKQLKGLFTSVSGLAMEVEYETYSEGGSNYPHFFFKETKPQVLVLEHGVITDQDGFAELMKTCVQGGMVPVQGEITLYDTFGNKKRVWYIDEAYLQKYVGPELNSNQPALAVTRVELIYNGCL